MISHSHDSFVATIANFIAQIWHGYVKLIMRIGEVWHICRNILIRECLDESS